MENWRMKMNQEQNRATCSPLLVFLQPVTLLYLGEKEFICSEFHSKIFHKLIPE